MSQEMSTDLQTPYISVLHHDILLHIFHLNTYDDENENGTPWSRYSPFRPTVTARFTSQVCRFWRQVILGSPTIWGSLIDITIADNKSDKWATEVMKRAGKALLSIYGEVGGTRRSSLFFSSLLKDHWNRVCRLDILLDMNSNLIKESIWAILWDRPAPNLQKFLIHGHPGTLISVSETKNGPLFCNLAPSLRRVHCPHLIRHINPKPSWISQLTSLTLTGLLTTSDVLRILSQTVQLELLVITTIALDVDVVAMDWSEKIHLPNLIFMVVVGAPVRGSLVCLKHIIPKPGCALEFDAEYGKNLLTRVGGATEQPNIMPDLEMLIPYTVSYFSLRKPTTTGTLTVIASRNTFHLDYTPDTRMAYFGRSKFELHLRFNHWAFINTATMSSMYEIFGAMSLAGSLDRISSFVLETKHDAWITPRNPNLHKFLLSLSSVHTISLTGYAVKVINDICHHFISAPVLPSLKQIDLTGHPASLVRHAEDVRMLLEHRRAAHIPISGLFLGEIDYLDPKDRNDWLFLDGFEGLIVS